MLRNEIEEKYPFISVITYGGNEYVGIIVNQDQYVTTILNFSSLKTTQDKQFLLKLLIESERMLMDCIILNNIIGL